MIKNNQKSSLVGFDGSKDSQTFEQLNSVNSITGIQLVIGQNAIIIGTPLNDFSTPTTLKKYLQGEHSLSREDHERTQETIKTSHA